MNESLWKDTFFEKQASVKTEARGMLKLMLPHLPASLQTILGKTALMALMTPVMTKEQIKGLSGKGRALLQKISPSVAAHDYVKRWQHAASKGTTIGQIERAMAREDKINRIIDTVIDPAKRGKALKVLSGKIEKDPILSAVVTGGTGAAAGALLASLDD